MKCKRCGSEKTYKNGKEKGNGKQKMKCGECGANFYEDYQLVSDQSIFRNPNANITAMPDEKHPLKVGMSITEFRKKHDVDYIVELTLKKLSEDVVYEKSDIINLCGLRAGYPGLSAALENATQYKGRAGGVTYWAHPETINKLKEQAIMI